MIPLKIRVGLAALVLAGCRDKASEMAKIEDVFPVLPLPPAASVVSLEGSPDALKLTLRSNAEPAMVEAYYRKTLSKNGWRLVSDARDAQGAVVLLAQENGPPLWVRIRSTDDSVATMVELSGAVSKHPQESKPAS
jgi:hypothetical protein